LASQSVRWSSRHISSTHFVSSRATAAGRLPKSLGDLSQSLCSPVESLMPNQRRGKTGAFSGARRA
jgi:hypothetical protein